MICIDIETCPIKISEIPKENKEYLIKKSENKRSGKIIDGEKYGQGAIGKFELSKILCCCVKKDDEEEIEAYYGDNEQVLIYDVFERLVHQDHIITFNGNSFDLPMLKMRGLIHGLYTYAIDFNIKAWSERCIDIRYQLTDKFGVGDLAYWCRAFSIKPPEWQIDDKSDLSKYPIADVVKGCTDDVRATSELYNKLNNAMNKESK